MSKFGKLEILAIAVVILAGSVHLAQPYRDDQTFFTIGAWKMNHGALLYRDYWDIKQPGIFLFYLAGGKLFGFDEIGIRGFELLYMVAFALILIVTLRDYFEYRWSNVLMVPLTIGFYYGVSGLPHVTLDYLTQVEGLVGFPMFLCAWYASRAADMKGSRSGNLLLSGIMGGLVLLFKLMYLPMILSFWFASFLYAIWGKRRNIFLDGLRFLAAVCLGAVLSVLPVCAYFAMRRGLGALWYSSFVWPIQAIGKLPLAGMGRLHEGLEFFVDGFAPLLGLGFLGAWKTLRTRRDILTINLLLWVVVGVVCILAQLRSWWPHHYLLLFVPVGILAAKGVEYLWDQLRASETSSVPLEKRMVLMVALGLLFSPVIYPTLINGLMLARYRFALNAQQRLNYQCKFPNSQYLTSEEIGFLSQPDSLPGPIYVGGTSLYYYLSGRLPAVSMCAGVDDFLPEQWTSFAKELATARPPYIFVSAEDQKFFDNKSPDVVHFIATNYRMLRTGRSGIWYVIEKPESRVRSDDEMAFRKPSPGCAPSDLSNAP